MHVSRSAIIEELAQTIGTAKFDKHYHPYQNLVAAALGGLAVLLVAAAFLTVIT